MIRMTPINEKAKLLSTNDEFEKYIKEQNKQIDYVIDKSNMVKVSYKSEYKKLEGKHEFKILQSRQEELLERLANIVNSDTSYSSCFYDDTIRIYKFIFENGKKNSYCCPIGNGNEYISQPMTECLNVNSLVKVSRML